MTIGTSERGRLMDEPDVVASLTERCDQTAAEGFNHALLVFGGLHGIEACVEGD